MKKARRWQPEAVLAGLLVVYMLVGVALHGCGGGGSSGGGGTVSEPPRSRQATQAVAQSFGGVGAIALTALSGGRGFNPRSGALSRQPACPTVTTAIPAPNQFVITLDYGSGCTDAAGNTYSGRLTMTVTDPRRNDAGVLVGGTVALSFERFTSAGQTISGTFTMTIDSATSLTMDMDLTYTSGDCTERTTANATITRAADESFTANGRGTYTSSALGSSMLSYEMTDLRFTSGCAFPVGGTLRVTVDGRTEVWSFSPASCGSATVSVGSGEPETVNLRDIPVCGR